LVVGMGTRKLNNQELDALGKRLVRRASMPVSEIDRIVGKADLFAGVTKRIAAVQPGSASGMRPYRYIKISFSVAAACVLVLSGLLVTSVFRDAGDTAVTTARGSQSDVSAVIEPVSGSVPDTAGTVDPPQGKVYRPAAARAYQRASRTTERRRQRVHRHRLPVSQHVAVKERPFIPLTMQGEPYETGGRVIRVEIPRSSLFAMGVNVPLENGPESVKADLLIASDGTPRGIRVLD
jgi:hypothetical protein